MRPEFGSVKQYAVGQPVQYSPAMDIWMRGCPTGRITSIRAGRIVTKPDYGPPSLRVRIPSLDYIRPNP